MQHYTNFEKSWDRSAFHPVQTPLPGQSPNNAGGFSWTVDDMTRLHRFLILGSMDGTYYIGARDLLAQNLACITRLLDKGDGRAVVDAVVDVSTNGRGSSNDQALLILAMCASYRGRGRVEQHIPSKRRYVLHRAHHAALFEAFEGVISKTQYKYGREEIYVRDGDTIVKTVRVPEGTVAMPEHPDDVALRQYALDALPKVARTGTHLFHFVRFVQKFRGWGPALRRAIQRWYLDMEPKRMAGIMLTYQARDKATDDRFSQRDILRLAHPKPVSATHDIIFHWVTCGWPGVGDIPHPDPALQTIWAFERAKRVSDPTVMAQLIREYRLRRESVPMHFLSDPVVWEALLHNMPAEGMEAMIRNLGNMTRIGLLQPGNEHTAYITRMLRDPVAVKKSRIHPINILAALMQYELGHGDSGGFSGKEQKHWQVVPEIVSALEKAFRLAFGNVARTGKKILLAIDVSGSMSGSRCNGLKHMTLHQAAAAMAVVLLGVEGMPNVSIVAVDTGVYPLPLHGDMPLALVANIIGRFGGGSTNLSLMFSTALKARQFFDCFIVLSDGETWQGKHPATVLEDYRREINPEARVVNVQMTATSIANYYPDDSRCLEVAGFDTSVPEIIHHFLCDTRVATHAA